MNNDQFRRLVLDKPDSRRPPNRSPSDGTSPDQPSRRAMGGATPSASALGSRQRSSIPMTPRTLTTPSFAHQLAEHRLSTQPPPKRFKSSAAPKGSKLAAGYQDRSALLRSHADEDGEAGMTELEKRVQALEEMVKLGQIDQGTFEKLRGEMGVGGDLGSTHMVKGLDWALLKRDELDKVLGEEVSAPRVKVKEKEKKKGVMAPPPPPQRKTRDQILRELRESRAAAAAAAAEVKPEPALGTKFKRIGGESKAEKKRWVEQDETGRRREILQITDAEGKTKRKVRWLDKPGEANGVPVGLLVPDKDAKPLGMEVPAEIASKMAPPEEEDDDIFAGVGDDYNPLGDLGEEDDSEDESQSEDEDGQQVGVGEKEKRAETAPVSVSDTKPAETTSKPRNYFATSSTAEEVSEDRSNPLARDPTLLAALKRAATLRQSEEGAGDAEEGGSETALRQKRFLEEARRREALDAMDMDMGFGGSRNDDDDEDEDVVLESEGRGAKKRKRGRRRRRATRTARRM
ncbi:hypothetical protein BO70DRAFT_430136 [Aspergillus heteromorphus CBS 117.55]|uniref:RED-like N-terminal domain-containing protein n=1 Tax=Aspergillus heteromorphus CBS 117.55 TaxID=1448321 RepID=A0A317VYW9_9EURO|nr:uncharacterized protein BO70DRAFT_430136 [Aspergillus heteromorphus CBS 117.55]PWY78212.1 hypothetical protein BO70DRAFT_430136 [Aspergillus heteromorphus CBS 117.55]